MVQFKRTFTGEEKRDYNRAVTSQKCVRAGGKHNDLENVGYTARHHTFFEMLGNFSFGDYFKERAIEFGWSLLTDGYGLPADKLYATVYEDDDEAYGLWQKVVGLPEDRISRLGEKDNFWAMGDTGPCGPCSEVLIDQGEAMGCDSPDCAPGCDCDRYLELWNLVFMQFERAASGEMTPLPKPSIDTGMGLERISAVVQGVYSNFETDLSVPDRLYPGTVGHSLPETDGTGKTRGHRTPAQCFHPGHRRPCPGLELPDRRRYSAGKTWAGDTCCGRILRRAVRHGRFLGINKPFLHQVAGRLIELMGPVYPELTDGANYIKKVIQNEEERFSETLDHGLKLLSEEMDRLKESGGTVHFGDVAFRLYDTYGFPLDLVQDVARESKYTVDTDGFEAAMSAQRQMSRASWKGSGEAAMPEPVAELTPPRVLKSNSNATTNWRTESELVLIMKKGLKTDQAGPGDEVELGFQGHPVLWRSRRSGGRRRPDPRSGNRDRNHRHGALCRRNRSPSRQNRVRDHQARTGPDPEVEEALRRDTMRNHTRHPHPA